MAGKQLTYLILLGLCGIFYIAYGQWLSYLLLVLMLGLPWISLLLSLPAIWNFRVSPAGPDALEMGQEPKLWLLGSCGYPMPPFRGRLRLRHSLTGQRQWYPENAQSLTAHCGSIAVTAEKVRICDYLGLFAFPVRTPDSRTIPIRPRPVAMEIPLELRPQSACHWKPRNGGGFSENHELRLYRPGDSLNQIHWKLSAKTGKLILRQSMEPQHRQILLTMHLRGSGEETDRKFGRLLYLGNVLLARNLPFELRVLTGNGVMSRIIADEAGFQSAMDFLLIQPPATEGCLGQQSSAALRQYHIGGVPDEA